MAIKIKLPKFKDFSERYKNKNNIKDPNINCIKKTKKILNKLRDNKINYEIICLSCLSEGGLTIAVKIGLIHIWITNDIDINIIHYNNNKTCFIKSNINKIPEEIKKILK